MTQSRNTILLLAAVVISIVSLPVNWMTLHIAKSAVGEFTMTFGSFSTSALRGQVSIFFVTIPLWLVAIVPAAAALSQLFSKSIPLQLVLTLIGITWMFAALGIALSTGQVTLRFGSLMGITAAVLPCYCLASKLIVSNPRRVPLESKDVNTAS